jgi:hypothetical protein
MTRENQDQAIRLDQFKIIYDYVKFHIGLYLGTPAGVAIIADALGLKDCPWFRIGLAVMIVVYAISGVHAGWFMGKYIHVRWTKDFPTDNDLKYFLSLKRRIWHHYLYWLGVLAGLGGLAISGISVPPPLQL